jgi:hypothetical protein
MSYLTQAQLDQRHALPLCLPLTELQPRDWLVIGTLRLLSGMRFSFRFLQLQLVEWTFPDGSSVNTDCSVRVPALVNPNFGYSYVAIFRNYSVNSDPGTLAYVGTVADVVNISTQGIAYRDTGVAALEIEEAADFTWLVVNNTTDANLHVAVQGQLNLDILT